MIFLEAYPKSRNKQLYSEVIDLDPDDKPNTKIPFYTFYGIRLRLYDIVFDESIQEKTATVGFPIWTDHKPCIEREKQEFISFLSSYESLMDVEKEPKPQETSPAGSKDTSSS